ncbi:MAG TPA: ROK family protein [Candidatus Limnocylindrales bacterium]|nr:ROK family protein [Candidatus Limnocylindrales bacterium]
MAISGRHIGLDLGGTNIKWAVVEGAGDDWRALDEGQVPTDVSGGERTVVPQLAELAVQIRDSAGGPVASLGVAVPGLYIPESGVVTFLTNVPGDWSATPVGEPVAEACGLPTALINDARAFGLAELRFGAGRDVHSFIGLTLGTGIGGVFALDNRVIQGYRGQAGELGHQTIDPDGPWCGCGNRGCVEAYARADQVALVCGTADPREAIEKARAGDAQARAGLAEIGRYLGIGIANAITVLTPELVILGGGWASAAELIIEPIKAEMRRRVITTPVDRIDVVLAELGTWAGAIGAAVHGAEQALLTDTRAAGGGAGV